jgi:hypothetical protein
MARSPRRRQLAHLAIDSSSVVPNAVVHATGLLTAFNFTWHGNTYSLSTVNTSYLSFGSGGELVQTSFGNTCTALGCGAHSGSEEWFTSVFSPGFTYCIAGGSCGVGTITLTPVLSPVMVSPVPAVSNPTALMLLAIGLFGTALVHFRQVHCVEKTAA